MQIEKTFQFESDVENLSLLNAYLEELFEKLNVLPNDSFPIEVCLEEIFVNICHYAYGENSGPVTVVIKADDNKIEIILKDKGFPYDPLKKEDPDINASIDERPIGGLGIFMVKKMLDDFIYDFDEDQNINTLVKKIS